MHQYSIMTASMNGIIDSVVAESEEAAMELFRARWDDADGPIPAYVRIVREN